MAQWDNQNLESQRSRVRLQAVLVFLLQESHVLINDIKKILKIYYLYCIVRVSQLFITCTSI